jgi:hypothetical protein
MIKLIVAAEEQYYGICKIGWPNGEEIFVDKDIANVESDFEI